MPQAKDIKQNRWLYTSKYSARDTGPYVYLDPFRKRTQQDYPESFIPIAAIVQGKFKSYFASSGPPKKPAETAQTQGDNAAPAEEEYDGPFNTEAAAESRILVVGDGHIGLDQHIQADGLMFMQNSIDWLIQSENLIAIRSKQIPQKPLKELPDVARKFIRWVNLIGPSILVIILGITLWQVRRMKKKSLNGSRIIGGIVMKNKSTLILGGVFYCS